MKINHFIDVNKIKLKIGHCKPKTASRYNLKRRGYIIPGRGANIAFFTSDTKRSETMEQHARERGIAVMLLHEGNVTY